MTKVSRAMANSSHDMDSLLERGDATGTAKAYRDHEDENDEESSTEGTDEDSSEGDAARTDHSSTNTKPGGSSCRCKIMIVSLLCFAAAGLLFVFSLDSSSPCARSSGSSTMAPLANGTDNHNYNSASQNMVAPLESNTTSIAENLDRKINRPQLPHPTVAPKRQKAPKGIWYTTEDSRAQTNPDSTTERTKPGQPTVPEKPVLKKEMPKATNANSEKDSPLSSSNIPESVDQTSATTTLKAKTKDSKAHEKASKQTNTNTQKNKPTSAPDSQTISATAKIKNPPDNVSAGWFQNAIQATKNPDHPKTYEEEMEVLQGEGKVEGKVDPKRPGVTHDEPKQLRGQHHTSKNENEAKQQRASGSHEKRTKKNEHYQMKTPEMAQETVEHKAKKKSPSIKMNTAKKTKHHQMNKKKNSKKTQKKTEQGKM